MDIKKLLFTLVSDIKDDNETYINVAVLPIYVQVWGT